MAEQVRIGQGEHVQFAWFAALCDDDTEKFGVASASIPSSFAHCLAIATEAERQGFDQILCPSGYELGIDAVTFAAAAGSMTNSIELLVAIRAGEMWGPQVVRQLASLDEIADGRLAINIISSDLPGETLDSAPRYERTRQLMAALRAGLGGDDLPPLQTGPLTAIHAPRISRTRQSANPLYFGGLSNDARTVAAEQADVYLMWPETEEGARELISDMDQRSATFGRSLRYGMRIHVVVREHERDARAAAAALVDALDADVGEQIIARSLDATSVGVANQRAMREAADLDGYIEANLWTGIGRARSGCGAAIVGDPDQVEAKLRRYMDLGISAFILSGYPHLDECRRFGELVLPRFAHGRLRDFSRE